MNSVFMAKYWYDKRKQCIEAAKRDQEAKLVKLEPDLDAQILEERQSLDSHRWLSEKYRIDL